MGPREGIEGKRKSEERRREGERKGERRRGPVLPPLSRVTRLFPYLCPSPLLERPRD